ncbi:MAG: restriction endonuclease subunit S [Acidobacteriota bacterium]|nr:restriction endonuclease subunit S [Acidobacteriota bacterium]
MGEDQPLKVAGAGGAWKWVRVGDIGRFGSGSGFPVRYQGRAQGDYPFFKVSDMNRDGNDVFLTESGNHITEHTRQLLGAAAFPPKSIVFAKVGAAVFLDRKRILAQPSCLDNNMAAFVLTDERVDISFVYFLLLTIRFSAFANTTALPALSGTALSEIRLHLPPLPEQRTIAAVLSDVDELIGSLEALIAKKRAIKQAAMQELLTGRKRLPGFGGEWETVTFADAANIRNGGTPRTGVPAYWGGRIPWCVPTDITASRGKYLVTTTRNITSEGLASCGASLLPPGSLLLCSRATIGEIKIASMPVATNQGFKSMVCADSVDNDFLYYRLVTLKERMIDLATGSTFLEISKRDLGNIDFVLPPLPEQRAIATVLSDMDSEITALEQHLGKTRAIKQGMMQQLLTGSIRLPIPDADTEDVAHDA